jgi:hypothetical protein
MERLLEDPLAQANSETHSPLLSIRNSAARFAYACNSLRVNRLTQKPDGTDPRQNVRSWEAGVAQPNTGPPVFEHPQ